MDTKWTPPGVVGTDSAESFTPLEALGVALRAVDAAETKLFTGVGTQVAYKPYMKDAFDAARVELARQFVKEGS